MKWYVTQSLIFVSITWLLSLSDDPRMTLTGATFGGFLAAALLTGIITRLSDWWRSRNNKLPPIGGDDGRSLGELPGFVGRLDADGSARSSGRRLPPGGG